MVGIDTKKHGVPLFRTSTISLTIHLARNKTTGIHWLLYDNNIPLLNSMKILTVQSVENFKNIFKPTSIWSDCRPAVRHTSTRSMAPNFLHNEGNRA